jgi:hypothetical protein
MFARIALTCLLLGAILATAATAHAQLVYDGQFTNGTPVFRDQSTGRLWTATLGQVRSDSWGADAAAMVQQRTAKGFRLPTFYELQYVYNVQNGGPVLGIRNRPRDYYETANPHILANASGNGIQTPLPRVGVGMNWVIATRP